MDVGVVGYHLLHSRLAVVGVGAGCRPYVDVIFLLPMGMYSLLRDSYNQMRSGISRGTHVHMCVYLLQPRQLRLQAELSDNHTLRPHHSVSMAIPATAEEISAKKECDRISSDILDYFSELANVQDPTDLSTKIEALSVRITKTSNTVLYKLTIFQVNLRARLARWPDGVRVYFYVDDIVEKTRDTLRTFLQEKEAGVLRTEEADNNGGEATGQHVEREKNRLGTEERENGARCNSALVDPKNVLPEGGSANTSYSGGLSDAPSTSTSSGKIVKSTRRRRAEDVSGEPEEQSGAKRRKTSPEVRIMSILKQITSTNLLSR